jgi:hypothetical protein
MSDNARLKEIQEEITTTVQLQLQKFMDLIDVRDREHAQRMDSLEMGNEGRISRIETAVESLLQCAAEEQHDETPNNMMYRRIGEIRVSHAIEWIFKAEQFFEYYNTPDNHHL